MGEEITVSGGVSRKELLLALQKAEITMEDEGLYTGNKDVDKLTKIKIALILANQG